MIKNNKEVSYFICWNYGFHHCKVKTTEYDFNQIIALLSDEFKIYKEDHTFNFQKYKKYYFYNYYGDKEIIGYVVNG